MHREYHPEEMGHRHAHAFDDHHGTDAHHDDHRALFGLTVVLGVLLGADILFGALGLRVWQRPFGVSLALIAAILGGARIVYGALEALVHGRIGADFALAQACIAALVLGEPFVAAEVVFIALVGEVLEAVTADRAMRAIHRLFEQTPRTARVRRADGELEIPVSQVLVDDLVIVAPGERVPIDGLVLTGRSSVDQSALTGEAIPVDRGAGERVYAGSINQFGVLEVRAEKVGHDTTLGQVLRLVAESHKRKAPLQRTADRYARYFLPVVETVALLTIIAGYALGWPDVWNRAVAVLVVACPCALILATPAAVMASMAWLARHGVIIKGGVALERIASCDTFAFDKTGTLTYGRPELASVTPLSGWSKDDVVRLAATAERASRHPLADAVHRAAAARGVTPYEAFDVAAQPGAGVSAKWRQDDAAPDAPARTLLVGNRRLLMEHGVALDETTEQILLDCDARGETPLVVTVDGVAAGVIGARDAIRPEAHDIIHDLKHLKIIQIAILTGDRASAARVVGKKTHIKTVESELLPADKAHWIQERQAAGRRVAMVGDGINDAPALATAQVGIALGGVGADLAAEAGDVVLLGEPLQVLPDLVELSRATVSVIRQNIVLFAFGLNAIAMGSATLGWLGPVPAAILHQAGSLLVLLNAMRLLAFGDWVGIIPVRWIQAARRSMHAFDDRFDPGLLAERALARWRVGMVLAILAGVGAYATWGWSAIAADEVGLVRRFGRFAGTLEPGLHLRLPPPFETVTRLKPGHVRNLEVGFRTSRPDTITAPVQWESAHDRETVARRDDEALALTGDGQIVEIAATAQFRLRGDVESLRKYAFGSSDPDAALAPLAESAVRATVSRRTLAELLTTARRETESAVAALLQHHADRARLGVDVIGFAFQEVHPPLAVVDAYRDVSRAESDRQRRTNEGNTYRHDQLARARGQAASTIQRAEADRTTRNERAAGEAHAFSSIVTARGAAPQLTDQRRFLETLEQGLAGKTKIILDPSKVTRRHLILPDGPIGMNPLAPAALGDRSPNELPKDERN